jgi:hypothetical protein
MVITVLKSRLVRLFASRTRLAIVLGAVVAAAAIAVPVAAGTASAATGAARPGAVTASRAAVFPAALGALACRTLTDCMAIGANTPQMANQMIAERWNGSHWSRMAMPKPAGVGDVFAGGIACPTNLECVAVGGGYPAAAGSGPSALAGTWNGSRWTVGRAAAPGVSSELAAVSCPSAASCYAVGSFTPEHSNASHALIEHWNGKKWSQQTAPDPRGTSFDDLADVSCSSAKFCVAVGTDGAGELIERWNGRGWSATTPKSRSSAILSGVSCPSATSCFAVGSNLTASGGSVVERWNGATWSGSVTPVPHGASYPGLQSVSCVSPTRCLAVGNDLNPSVYAASWNGSGWHLGAVTATGGHLGDFDEVRCLTATSCVALAATTQFAASARSESAFWNGTRWKVVLTA